MTELTDLATVAGEFAAFDTLDVSASLAALQLLPDDSGALGRLEQAAIAAASVASDGPEISRGRLSSILDQAPASTTLAGGDPYFDEVLTEPLTFPGGVFLVSPGLGRDAVYVAEQLTRRIFLRPDGIDPDFLAETGPTCLAALRLSDFVLNRAGLDRYARPQGSPTGPVSFGQPGQLAKLKEAVTLTREELEWALAPYARLAALEPLITDQGAIDLGDETEVQGRLLAAPILRADDTYVVALPLALLEAVRHFVLSSAVRANSVDEVAQRFRSAVASDVENSLRQMGMEELDITLPDGGDLPLAELLFRCDDDKLVYVQVVTDELIEYDVHAPYGEWKTRPGLDISLDARHKRVNKFLRNNGFAHDPVMHLFVSELIGRERLIGFGGAVGSEPTGPRLSLSAADLRTVSALERREPLALFNYAANRQAYLPTDHPLALMDQLGIYALYRANGHTLRLDYTGIDLEKPFQFVGAGLHLREGTKRRADVHAARYEGEQGVRVRRYEVEGDREPIYLADPPPDLSLPLLVESLAIPLWIHQSEASSAQEAEDNGAFQHMVAFWFWQLSDELKPLFTAAAEVVNPIHVWLDLSGRAAWMSNRPGDPTETGSAQIGSDTEIKLEVKAGDWERLAHADNAGEKAIIKTILGGIVEMANRAGHDFDESDLNGILDQAFANPRKKHLLLLSTNNVDLAPGHLPRYRPIQDGDRDEVRAKLGSYLQRHLGVAPGPIPDDRRIDVLGTARDWLLSEVERQVAELAPTDLLERALALNEAVVRQHAMQRLKVPTRLACYETELEVQERLTREMQQANLAGIVHRFLVEYVVAVPASGTLPVTNSRLDRMAATAAELQEIAVSLDAQATGLSDVSWIINYLGDLKLAEEDPYERAQVSFLGSHVRAAVESAERSFESHWDQPEDAPEEGPSLVEATAQKVDQAFKAESGGLSLLDFRGLVEQLVLMGRGQTSEPKQFRRADLESKLVSELKWSDSKVEAGIDFLLLGPRGSFYSDSTPSAWRKSDVQPWRFNRRLSLNRRPLLLRQSESGDQILYGMRQLWKAWPLQVSYLVMSKFKADSPDLVKLLGAAGDERGKQFEEKVAELYEHYPDRFEVLKGRDRFGGKRLERVPGQDLGDIDVLVGVPGDKELIAIEAKDIAMALTPSEVADELATHFQTADNGDKRAAMDRHEERIEWLRQHLPDVLCEFSFGGADPSNWTVDGLFVTDDPVPSAYVIRPRLPVISYRELEAALQKPPRKKAMRKTRARRS
jgi:hypothetical protein